MKTIDAFSFLFFRNVKTIAHSLPRAPKVLTASLAPVRQLGRGLCESAGVSQEERGWWVGVSDPACFCPGERRRGSSKSMFNSGRTSFIPNRDMNKINWKILKKSIRYNTVKKYIRGRYNARKANTKHCSHGFPNTNTPSISSICFPYTIILKSGITTVVGCCIGYFYRQKIIPGESPCSSFTSGNYCPLGLFQAETIVSKQFGLDITISQLSKLRILL